MNATLPELDWIETQYEEMCRLLQQWVLINSGSMNLAGLAEMSRSLQAAFGRLEGEMQEIALPAKTEIDSHGDPVDLPLGKALLIQKRPEAARQVFLGGHMDTVFAADHPFQKIERLDENRLNGPGVADLKGGLVVILKALEAFERSSHADQIGWKVLINPDEEIGSFGSAPLFEEMAKKSHLGLIFEPAMDDQGTLAAERKGSGSFTAVVRGKAAHAGRAFGQGRNAVAALAELIVRIHAFNRKNPRIILNVGHIEGGGAINIVPDLAICRFNVRTHSEEDEGWVWQELNELAEEFNQRDGFFLSWHGEFNRKPKLLSKKNRALFEALAACGKELEIPIQWKSTGGCCDGNNLAAAGLPNIDTLGVRGGKIHSDQEYILLDSLTERARLTALLLMKLSAGEIDWSMISNAKL
ncbi:MAG: hydrolase [SAR324 cluster bacterium]|nr:hydrolase [SAR324 cluster bacterium]